jgi:hypothetical protein
LFSLGFGIGILASYVMISYEVMGWEGESDIRLPGWGWLIGLGLSSFTVFIQYVAPESRAQSVRDWGINIFIIFICVLGIMSQRDRTVSLIQASTITTFFVVVAIFIGVVVMVKVSEWLPADPATSYMLPLNFVLLVFGEDQFPFPNTDLFLWPVVVGGTVMMLVRILFFSAILRRCRGGKKNDDCCSCCGSRGGGETTKSSSLEEALRKALRRAQQDKSNTTAEEAPSRPLLQRPPPPPRPPPRPPHGKGTALTAWMHQQQDGPPLTNPLIGLPPTGVYE